MNKFDLAETEKMLGPLTEGQAKIAEFDFYIDEASKYLVAATRVDLSKVDLGDPVSAGMWRCSCRVLVAWCYMAAKHLKAMLRGSLLESYADMLTQSAKFIVDSLE